MSRQKTDYIDFTPAGVKLCEAFGTFLMVLASKGTTTDEEDSAMKKLLSLALACLLLFSLSACGREPKEEVSDEKPVIYLYPEQETDVRVTLDLAGGELTCAYPAYGDGWSVRAAPDGTLTDGRARRGRITTFRPASASRERTPRRSSRMRSHSSALIARRRTSLSSTGCRRCRTTPTI